MALLAIVNVAYPTVRVVKETDNSMAMERSLSFSMFSNGLALYHTKLSKLG